MTNYCTIELLIVPYGIETIFTSCSSSGLTKLLIVPYGIETLFTLHVHQSCVGLLIVPYGIETTVMIEYFNLIKTF